MKLRHLFLAASLAVVAAGAHAEGFSDTLIGVRDSLFVANPGGNPGSSKGSRDVNKVIFNVGHFDVWDYGSNFFNVDALLSNPNEAAYHSSGGSTEYYGLYRGQLSPDKIFGINTNFGFIQAINFEFGGDLETENTQFAPNKKLVVAGPNFHFNVPAGFLDIGVHVSKEWNNNGFCTDACAKPGGPVSFHATPEFEFVWLFPLSFTGLPLDFRGFMNIILPKGKTGFGGETVTEVLARPQVQLDLGKMLWGKSHKPDVYLAVEVWENKFGNNHHVPGTEQIAPTVGIEYHF